jgi:hypothetical protein
LKYMIMSSANKDTLTISLSICISFISSSCLIASARNSRTILNKAGENGHPYLIPYFRSKLFQFSPSKYDVSYSFVLYSLYNVEVHSFYS